MTKIAFYLGCNLADQYNQTPACYKPNEDWHTTNTTPAISRPAKSSEDFLHVLYTTKRRTFTQHTPRQTRTRHPLWRLPICTLQNEDFHTEHTWRNEDSPSLQYYVQKQLNFCIPQDEINKKSSIFLSFWRCSKVNESKCTRHNKHNNDTPLSTVLATEFIIYSTSCLLHFQLKMPTDS